ncbi:hypothetical protein ABK040_005207 [Willaertia magna]
MSTANEKLVAEIYRHVIQEVTTNCQPIFEEEGFSTEIIQVLKKLWEDKISTSGAVPAWNAPQHHTATTSSNRKSKQNQQQHVQNNTTNVDDDTIGNNNNGYTFISNTLPITSNTTTTSGSSNRTNSGRSANNRNTGNNRTTSRNSSDMNNLIQQHSYYPTSTNTATSNNPIINNTTNSLPPMNSLHQFNLPPNPLYHPQHHSTNTSNNNYIPPFMGVTTDALYGANNKLNVPDFDFGTPTSTLPMSSNNNLNTINTNNLLSSFDMITFPNNNTTPLSNNSSNNQQQQYGRNVGNTTLTPLSGLTGSTTPMSGNNMNPPPFHFSSTPSPLTTLNTPTSTTTPLTDFGRPESFMTPVQYQSNPVFTNNLPNNNNRRDGNVGGMSLPSIASITNTSPSPYNNLVNTPLTSTPLSNNSGINVGIPNFTFPTTPMNNVTTPTSSVGGGLMTPTLSYNTPGSNNNSTAVESPFDSHKKIRLQQQQQFPGQYDGADDNEEEEEEIGDDDDEEEDNNEDEEEKEVADEELGSEDDVEEERVPETSNIVLAQYEKVNRHKSRWKCTLKSGVMHLEGKDYLFNKLTGDFEWK